MGNKYKKRKERLEAEGLLQAKPKTLLEFFGSQEKLWEEIDKLKVGEGLKLNHMTGKVERTTCVQAFGINWRVRLGR